MGIIAGLYQAVEYRVFDNTVNGGDALDLYLAALGVTGISDRVINCFYFPSHFINMDGISINRILSQTQPISITRNTGVPDYVGSKSFKPNNNKLYTYPFSYLVVDAGTASQAYKWEFFTSPSDIDFKFYGVLSTDPAIVCVPYDYENMEINVTKQLLIKGFDPLPLTMGCIAPLLGNNGVVSSLLGIYMSTSMAMSNPNLAIAGQTKRQLKNVSEMDSYGTQTSTMLGTDNSKGSEFTRSAKTSSESYTLGEDRYAKYRAENDIVMNTGQQLISFAQSLSDHSTLRTGAGNPNIVTGKSDVRFIAYSVSEQFARKIDKFFDCYGYAINSVGRPNPIARPRWTYIKTRGCIVNGPFPNSDKVKIETILDQGIRFWRATNGIVHVGDYTQDNRPVANHGQNGGT